MACQSINVFEIWKELAMLTVNSVKELDSGLEEQTLKLDAIYNNLLKCAKKDVLVDYEPEKKSSKRQSKNKNGQVGDLFAEPSFQQPAVPPIRKTRRQASMMAADKTKNTRESATISSGPSTRASRARALSTFLDIAPIDFPKANSTFVVDKKFMGDIDECLSPPMFSPVKNTKIKSSPNATYNMPTKSTAINTTVNMDNNVDVLPEKSPVSVKINSNKKIGSKKNSEEYLVKNKPREKLEDIDVNVEGKSQHMTRTMKRKLQEDIQSGSKKPNVIHVPLEKQISTPMKQVEDIIQTPHQIRENEAEKRKELYLKSKADQKKFEDVHLKVAKQREEQNKRIEEKARKTAEEKKRKEEKQKEKDLLLKEEILKKQKQQEQRLAEINAKRKQADEAKLLKLQKIEMERKLKEAEIKKKNELKPEKSKSIRPKVVTSNLPSSSIAKVATLPKAKIDKTGTNKNDYGLNDVSACDSSEDESGPKKQVPNWAKRENRKAVLEIQYHVDSKERDMFFDCPKQMSLKEMFKGWNIRDRQRTSSAVWITPPRYSDYIRRH